MVKNIILHVDEAFFFKLKEAKSKLEKKYGIPLTWENYIKHLFHLK